MIPEKIFNILVLEDNFGDFYLLKEYLEECLPLVNVVQIERFKDLKEQSSIDTFDYIFLDMSLPDKSGEELIQEVLNIAKTIPVIALTGFSDQSFSKKALELGVTEYLLKDDLNSIELQNKIFDKENGILC